MISGIWGSRELIDEPRCPNGHVVTVHYAERDSEEIHPQTEEITSCTFIHSWLTCNHYICISQFPSVIFDERFWSDPIWDDDPITDEHVEQATNGAIEVWREWCEERSHVK